MATSGSVPNCTKCLWCSDTQFMRIHLCQYLKSLDTKSRSAKNDSWIEQATHSLSTCTDCVDVFHQLVKEEFNSNPQSKAKYLEPVNRSITSRLRESFSTALDETDCAQDSEEDDEQCSQLSQYRSHTLGCPIRELLMFPKLLMSEELNKQLAAAIEHLDKIDELPQINNKHPGIYLLLVHPNPKVRSWAVRTVKSLGSVDWDDYDEIEEVINWMMAVINFNLFVNDDDLEDIAVQRQNQAILPKHLFIHNSPKDFWVGICMLVKAMDGGCIRSRLMSVNGHRGLVDAVLLNLKVNADKSYTSRVDKTRCTLTHLTTQSASATVFWPAMQCFSVLLDKLGSRFWQLTSVNATTVLHDIFSNPYYCFELTQWASLNSVDEDTEDASTSHDSDSELVTNSQIVQNWKPSLRPQKVIQLTQAVVDDWDYETEEEVADGVPTRKKSRTSVYSWMSPFINSILDFGEGSYPNIECLLKVTHMIFVKAMSEKSHFEFIRDGKWCADFNSVASPVVSGPVYNNLSYSAFANEAFLSLISIVEILVSKSFFVPLTTNQNYWLDDVVLGAKALIQHACSMDYISGHPTSLQQLSKLMVEFMTSDYARRETDLAELLSFFKNNALIKQGSSSAMGSRTSILRYAAGSFLRNKLINVITHCESSVFDNDFQSSKSTSSNNSKSNQDKSPPTTKEQLSKLASATGSPNDSDRDRTPDLFSDDDFLPKLAFGSNIQEKGKSYQHATCNFKTCSESDSAGSSTDDELEPPLCLKGLDKGTASRKGDASKDSAPSLECTATSLSKSELSKGRGIKTDATSVANASNPVCLPLDKDLQHKSAFLTCPDVVMVLSDSDEELLISTSSDLQPKPPLNVNDDRKMPLTTSGDPQCCHNQSSAPRVLAKVYSLDCRESTSEGLSELRKMVDPVQRRVIDLRDNNENSPSHSTDDSDDDGIPVMEQFANLTRLVAGPSGSAHKHTMAESDTEDRCCYNRPSFLSLSEETSDSDGYEYKPPILPTAEKVTVSQKSSLVPASETREPNKPAVRMKECKVIVQKCEEGYKLFPAGDKGDLSPILINIKNTGTSCPAGVSNTTEDRTSPCPMDISDPDLASPLQKTDLVESASANTTAVTQLEIKQKAVDDQTLPRREQPTKYQCHLDYSTSARIRSAVLSPSEVSATNLHTSLVVPVATVTPMGFRESASILPPSQELEGPSCEPPKRRRELLPARKLPSNRRKVPTYESCQAQASPGLFKNPNHYNCVPKNPDLLSTIMANSTNLQTSKAAAVVVPSVKVSTATVNRVVVTTKPKVPLRMNDFYTKVLLWDPEVFLYPQENENRQLICPSPEGFPHDLSMPPVFHTIDQYYQVFSPLLLAEVWEEVYNGTQMNSAQIPPPCVMKVETISAADHPLLQVIKCKTEISSDLGKQYAHPVQHHLVLIEFEHHQHGTMHLFAFVDSYNRVLQHSQAERDACNPSGQGYYELSLCLRVRRLESSLSSSLENHKITCRVVTNLADSVRKWNGLVNLHTSPLVANILTPLGGVYFGGGKQQASESLRDDVFRMLGEQYNDSQKNAVLAAVHATKTGFVHPRICLLQGPPGTGKTHTIVGLIRALFRVLRPQQPTGCSLPGQRFGALQQTAPHILLCAPSNTAVDEVVKRLIQKGLVKNTKQWKEKYKDQLIPNADHTAVPGFSVIRVGQDLRIDPVVKPVSLDELARKDMSEERSLVPQQLDQLRKNISVLEKEIESLEKELCLAKKSDTAKASKLEQVLNQKQAKRDDLIMQNKDAKAKQRNHHREESIVRKRLLMDADIVCSTLCGSGSSVMECFLTHPLHFSCVIVDEASQCCELDMLIPLRYKSSKLILIGDPLQLPATVKSQVAQEHGLGQSLFERLYNHFSQSNDEENPVKMLQIQYRMLPEICQFPSQHFYKGKILSASDMNDTSFPFKPFLVFNVTTGHEEIKNEGSISNETEAKLALKLCKVLLGGQGINCSKIGIITPYKAQETLIKTLLRDKLVGQNIDVGTVDSYQGKEKLVTILSCVRAKSTAGSIGFLWSRQRMNVSLTRGKKALYVLCHVESLKISPDWDALIRSAIARNAVISVTNSNFDTVADDIVKPATHSGQTSSSSNPQLRTVSSKDNARGSSASLPRPGEARVNSTTATALMPSSTCASAVAGATSHGTREQGRAEPCVAVRDPRLANREGQPTSTAVVYPLPRRAISTPSIATSKTPVQRTVSIDAGTRDGDRSAGSGLPGRTKREGSVEILREAKKAKLEGGGQLEAGESSNSTWRPHGGERPRKAHPNAAVIHRRQLSPVEESPTAPKRKLSAREEIERKANRKSRGPGS